MRALLVVFAVFVVGCAAEPLPFYAPPPAPRVEAPVATEQAPIVSSTPDDPARTAGSFVQLEVVDPEATAAELAALGVEVDPRRGVEATPLDPFQVSALWAPLHEVQWRGPRGPVLTLLHLERATVGVPRGSDEDVLVLDVSATIGAERSIDVAVTHEDDDAKVTLRDGASAILRVRGETPRSLLLTAKVISLRDEDAKRYTLEQD